MKTSKPNKKKVILILWGFLLSIIVIVFLTILLLSLQTKQSNKQEPVSNVKTNSQQEQETYNKLMSKIESEVNKLTSTTKVVMHYTSGKPQAKEEYDQTGKKIKYILLDEDGETIHCIKEYNPETGNKIKETYYNYDGTVKKVKNFK